MKLINAQRNKIISENLGVSVECVRTIITGRRGKWNTENQQKVQKAVSHADATYDKANNEIVQYCRELKVEVVVPK